MGVRLCRLTAFPKCAQGRTTKIQSGAGGEFDCYVAVPKSNDTVPAIVLASAVHGVDADICAIADEFAANGFLAAAPDLFWRTIPGPLPHDDGRVGQRSQPRLDRIKEGERDMMDTLAYLRTVSLFSGAAAVMGFCYGGPYAIIGPKRLGYAAGISCHGTQMLDYVGNSTACAPRSALSGAIATIARHPKCSTPTGPLPRA